MCIPVKGTYHEAESGCLSMGAQGAIIQRLVKCATYIIGTPDIVSHFLHHTIYNCQRVFSSVLAILMLASFIYIRELQTIPRF